MTAVAASANAAPQVNTLFGAKSSTVQGTQTTGSTGTSGAPSADPSQQQDRFLKLLVAQLNNQDPMNPMDNAQMTSQLAQINTVTGIQQLNQTVTSLMNQFASMQVMQSAGLVGHEVLVEGSTLSVDKGTGRGGIALSQDASDVSVQVTDANGAVLKTVKLGSMSAGNQTFEVDTSDLPTGNALSFKVSASKAGQVVSATPLICDKVVSISTGAQGVTLDMAHGKSVPYLSLKTVL